MARYLIRRHYRIRTSGRCHPLLQWAHLRPRNIADLINLPIMCSTLTSKELLRMSTCLSPRYILSVQYLWRQLLSIMWMQLTTLTPIYLSYLYLFSIKNIKLSFCFVPLIIVNLIHRLQRICKSFRFKLQVIVYVLHIHYIDLITWLKSNLWFRPFNLIVNYHILPQLLVVWHRNSSLDILSL